MKLTSFIKNTKFLALTICTLIIFSNCKQTTSNDQQKITNVETKDIAMMVDLVNDSIAIQEYEKYHAKVWPEVIQASEVAEHEKIDIYRLGNKLVMILTVAKDWDGDKASKKYLDSSPKVKEWLSIMEKYQKPSPEAPLGTSGWTVMKNVFSYKNGKQQYAQDK